METESIAPGPGEELFAFNYDNVKTWNRYDAVAWVLGNAMQHGWTLVTRSKFGHMFVIVKQDTWATVKTTLHGLTISCCGRSIDVEATP